MTEEKFGIENVKKLFDLGLEGINVAGHWSSEEGKGAAELFRLTDEVMVIPSVDWKMVDDEFKDISEAEMLVFKKQANDKVDIPQDKIEFIVKKCIFMGWKTASLVKDCFDLADMIKEAKKDTPESPQPAS